MKRWRAKIKEVFATLSELRAYDDIHNIVKKCGFDTVERLWDINPEIEAPLNLDKVTLL